MELKNYIQELKIVKDSNHLLSLTHAILKNEEILIENYTNIEIVKIELRNLLNQSFFLIKEHKIEINNSEVKDLDLDYWKDNIASFKSKNPDMNREVYLYSIRNSLKYLIETKKTKNLFKAHLFEIIIKTFLFIDFLDLSIDKILENKEGI
jgi:hypothetical protein